MQDIRKQRRAEKDANLVAKQCTSCVRWSPSGALTGTIASGARPMSGNRRADPRINLSRAAGFRIDTPDIAITGVSARPKRGPAKRTREIRGLFHSGFLIGTSKSETKIGMANTYEANFHRDAVWKGNHLIFKRRVVASIVADSKYPQMWRVRLPSGHLTDIVNLTRAKDAARSLALKALIVGPVGAPPMRSFGEAAE